MCNSEMDLGLEASKYKNPRFDIVSRIAYLLGVSEEYFLGEESNFDEKIYTELEECKDGRIVRNLCIIRTALLRNNGRIRNLFQYDMKNIDTIPEYIAPECIKKLKKDEVDIWRANWTPAKYVVLVSAEIKKHINGCKNSFPLWLNWDYVKDMFCLPELKERQVSKLVESYGEKRNRFPYTMYVVGALSVEVGNILYNDEKFVSYLYRRNGDMFDDLSKVTDASDEIKKNIIEMYAMATSQIRVLKMRSESLVLANVQYEISEKNFANGTIESSDLAVDKERQSTAREAYENSKFELTKSLMILEVISRTPIIRK